MFGITLKEIFASIIIYGVVHVFYRVLKWAAFNSERKLAILAHFSRRHNHDVLVCTEGTCTILKDTAQMV